MWRTNDNLEEERPSKKSADFLLQPEVQSTHSDKATLASIMEQEEDKVVGAIEGERIEKMDVKDKQNIQLFQNTSPSVSAVNQSLAHQGQASASTMQQDYRNDMSLNGTKVDLGPDSDVQCSLELSCPRCKKRFTSSQGLERHMQTHAQATCHTQQYKCSRCRRTFSTLLSRRRHEKRHDNRNRNLSNTTSTVGPNVSGSGELLSTNLSSKDDKLLLNPNPCMYTAADGKQKDASSKNNNGKPSNICKYCKKAFRTHTSLRRHQRRIHERHLLPKVRCKNVTITQESNGQQLGEPAHDSQSIENISQEREYMVDISSNISENLSFYIDGKIVSTSAVSNCDVLEMNSEGSAVIGLNAVIISPAHITQALKLEANTSSLTFDLSGQSSTKRRTSTPPLLPQIKTQLESESILTTSSSSSSLSLSSTSGAALVAAQLPQSTETVALYKEKTVYLSPKLKQLLQNQDGGKPSYALIADGQNLSPSLSLTILPASTRFKRRTTSPPSSPQQSLDLSVDNVMTNPDSAETIHLELENPGAFPGLSFSGIDEIGHLNPTTDNSNGLNMEQQGLPLDCSVSRTGGNSCSGGNSCNQQPLDLSNSMGKTDHSEGLAESILDLSIGGKSLDCVTHPALRKGKPNSNMLQKVLMNECGGVDIPSIDVTPDITNFTVMALPDSGPLNSENLLLKLAASLQPNPSLPAPDSIHSAPSTPPPQDLSSSPPPFVSFLSTSTVEPSQGLQTLCSTLFVSDTLPPRSTVEDCTDNPVHLSQGDLKVTIPDWVTSAPGGVTHTLIPTAPSLSLQGPQWVSDPALCDLAQRTLVVDSLLASDAQIFSPSLSLTQSDITSLTFPPNTVVIEYTVALQSTENIVPCIQANSVNCLSDNLPIDATVEQELYVTSEPPTLSPYTTQENSTPVLAAQSLPTEQCSCPTDDPTTFTGSTSAVKEESKEEVKDNLVCPANTNVQPSDYSEQDNKIEDESSPLHPYCKNFMCNVCDHPFQSMKSLSQHVSEHSKEWPYKCEFCVQLFESDKGLLEHRSSYHGIGKIYVCETCSKEFAFLCNLEQHQRDLHPGQECSHTAVVHGKLRPENHNNPKTDIYPELSITEVKQESDNTTSKGENDDLNSMEELYTTIKIMASGAVKPKGPDVRLGINQHYPSFKPPPFPYHNRTLSGTTAASATNFTTHNIPQTFSTAIRCTKCGNSFDNMPELHKHILACANASDKKRYTPKKNPIPLQQFAKVQNGVLSPHVMVNSKQNLSQKFGQQKKLTLHESPVKIKINIMNRKKSQLVQKGRPAGGRKAFAQNDLGFFACPHCSREFTYNASLKKHVAFSCPMRPVSGKCKKRNLIVSVQENNGSLRRQIANTSAKPHRSNHGPKTITKTQINKPIDATQEIRSAILSSSVIQPSKTCKPVLKGSFVPKLASVPLSVAQVNSQEPGIRVHVLGRKIEHKIGDVKMQPRREDCLSMRMRERVEGPVTRSVQQANTTTTLLKQSDSHNIIMRPVVLQVKKLD
ncbi:PR domain zinc finger protein 2 [Paramisgurnus dabryanus]|uniref:PR domain zinc finger protein 2 n=1 Tax=Paramisgurnus dabryanus TaxID=90735 RepID=UPI0031F3620F